MGNFDRRDFLKLGGLALLGAAGASSIGKLFGDENFGRKLEDDFLEIRTPEASYFPLLDIHTKKWDFADIPNMPKLNDIFYEFRMPQDKLLELLPEEVFNLKTTAGAGDVAVPDIERQYWREKETSIFVEGQITPEASDLIAIGSELSEAMLGTAWLLKRIIGSGKHPKESISALSTNESADDAVSGNKVIHRLGDVLAGWSVSQIASVMFSPLGKLSDKPNDPRRSILNRTIDRIVGFSSHLHPENALVFFRNLNFVRQLNLCARSERGRNFDLPNIGYLVGSGHSGVTDLLQMGDDVIYGLMEAYPRGFWEKFVEKNGGVEILSQTPIFDPQGKKWEKRVVKDERFKRFLLRMIDDERIDRG